MRFVLQRIVHNDLRWTGPSIGRLHSRLDKGYLFEHGFAHEDWNFKQEHRGDFVYGYAYFRPRNPREGISIAFATYEKGGIWSLAGFYDNAHYVAEGAPFPKAILNRRARELVTLQREGSLGGEYRRLTRSGLANALLRDARSYHWRVQRRDVHNVPAPIAVPEGILPKNSSRYFSRPTDISHSTYLQLKRLARGRLDVEPADNYGDGGDTEFPEGKKLQEIHFRRERNRSLVAQFKRHFKARHGKLFCEVCNFNFSKTYGQLGVDFIEAPHKIPVHTLREDSSTKIRDLACVCSNCHRMLHKSGTSMTLEALRAIILTNER